MNTAALIEKIEALAYDEREAVEKFVAQGQANALDGLRGRRSAIGHRGRGAHGASPGAPRGHLPAARVARLSSRSPRRPGARRMTMHNPPHPGEFIAAMYLEPHGISGRQLAAKLNVAPSTLNRILLGTSAVSPEMALRLAKTLGRSPESWLSLQHSYDLWKARRRVDLAEVLYLKLATAARR